MNQFSKNYVRRNTNPNYNQTNQHQNQQHTNNYNRQNNFAIAQNPTTNTQSSGYLEEVRYFVYQMGIQKLLPKSLNANEAIQIVLVADRFLVPRLDALRSWAVKNQSVVISSHFLLSLLISQRIIGSDGIIMRHFTDAQNPYCFVSINRLSRETSIGECFFSEKVDNPTWVANSYYAAEEIALMRCLRNTFPQLTIGVISPAELQPSLFSKVKSFSISFYKLVKGFFLSCFAKEEKVSKSSADSVPLVAKPINSYAEEDLTLDVDDAQLKDSKEFNTSRVN
ncbi:MAG: hypothetical protein WAQ98_02685 [Blastocatellia bacterium]